MNILIDNNLSNPYFITSLVLAIVISTLVVFICLVFNFYHQKHIKTHSIYIYLDGGSYQNSKESLVLKAKTGKEIYLGDIKPTKEGFIFNGFNVYRNYVSSTINEAGIIKESITSEIMDGLDKTVIIMPNYDLYFVAKYSPLINTSLSGLKQINYYPNLITYEDIISEIMHLNNSDDFPIKINIYTIVKDENLALIYKNETIMMIIKSLNGVNKLYFRTQNNLDNYLIDSNFQEEDLNDAYNWFSFVVNSKTKMSLILNIFKEIYNELDDNFKTSKVELNLLLSSLSGLADPIFDRECFILKNDLQNKKEVNEEENLEKVEPKANKVEQKVINADGEEFMVSNLTILEEKELQIKKSPLNYKRVDLIEFLENNYKNKFEIIKKDAINRPIILKYNDISFALIYENRFGLVRIILRLSSDDFEKLKVGHENFNFSPFPKNDTWYQLYLDNSFTDKQQILDIFNSSLKEVSK